MLQFPRYLDENPIDNYTPPPDPPVGGVSDGHASSGSNNNKHNKTTNSGAGNNSETGKGQYPLEDSAGDASHNNNNNNNHHQYPSAGSSGDGSDEGMGSIASTHRPAPSVTNTAIPHDHPTMTLVNGAGGGGHPSAKKASPKIGATVTAGGAHQTAAGRNGGYLTPTAGNVPLDADGSRLGVGASAHNGFDLSGVVSSARSSTLDGGGGAEEGSSSSGGGGGATAAFVAQMENASAAAANQQQRHHPATMMSRLGVLRTDAEGDGNSGGAAPGSANTLPLQNSSNTATPPSLVKDHSDTQVFSQQQQAQLLQTVGSKTSNPALQQQQQSAPKSPTRLPATAMGTTEYITINPADAVNSPNDSGADSSTVPPMNLNGSGLDFIFKVPTMMGAGMMMGGGGLGGTPSKPLTAISSGNANGTWVDEALVSSDALASTAAPMGVVANTVNGVGGGGGHLQVPQGHPQSTHLSYETNTATPTRHNSSLMGNSANTNTATNTPLPSYQHMSTPAPHLHPSAGGNNNTTGAPASGLLSSHDGYSPPTSPAGTIAPLPPSAMHPQTDLSLLPSAGEMAAIPNSPGSAAATPASSPLAPTATSRANMLGQQVTMSPMRRGMLATMGGGSPRTHLDPASSFGGGSGGNPVVATVSASSSPATGGGPHEDQPNSKPPNTTSSPNHGASTISAEEDMPAFLMPHPPISFMGGPSTVVLPTTTPDSNNVGGPSRPPNSPASQPNSASGSDSLPVSNASTITPSAAAAVTAAAANHPSLGSNTYNATNVTNTVTSFMSAPRRSIGMGGKLGYNNNGSGGAVRSPDDPTAADFILADIANGNVNFEDSAYAGISAMGMLAAGAQPSAGMGVGQSMVSVSVHDPRAVSNHTTNTNTTDSSQHRTMSDDGTSLYTHPVANIATAAAARGKTNSISMSHNSGGGIGSNSANGAGGMGLGMANNSGSNHPYTTSGGGGSYSPQEGGGEGGVGSGGAPNLTPLMAGGASGMTNSSGNSISPSPAAMSPLAGPQGGFTHPTLGGQQQQQQQSRFPVAPMQHQQPSGSTSPAMMHQAPPTLLPSIRPITMGGGIGPAATIVGNGTNSNSINNTSSGVNDGNDGVISDDGGGSETNPLGDEDDDDPFADMEQRWCGVTAAILFAFTDPPSITVESLRIVLLSTSQLLALGASLVAQTGLSTKANATAVHAAQQQRSGSPSAANQQNANATTTAQQQQQDDAPIIRNPFRAPSLAANAPLINTSAIAIAGRGGVASASGGGGGPLQRTTSTASIYNGHLKQAWNGTDTLTVGLHNGYQQLQHLLVPLSLVIHFLRMVGVNLGRFRALPNSPLAQRLAEITVKDLEEVMPYLHLLSTLHDVGCATANDADGNTPYQQQQTMMPGTANNNNSQQTHPFRNNSNSAALSERNALGIGMGSPPPQAVTLASSLNNNTANANYNNAVGAATTVTNTPNSFNITYTNNNTSANNVSFGGGGGGVGNNNFNHTTSPMSRGASLSALPPVALNNTYINSTTGNASTGSMNRQLLAREYAAALAAITTTGTSNPAAAGGGGAMNTATNTPSNNNLTSQSNQHQQNTNHNTIPVALLATATKQRGKRPPKSIAELLGAMVDSVTAVRDSSYYDDDDGNAGGGGSGYGKVVFYHRSKGPSGSPSGGRFLPFTSPTTTANTNTAAASTTVTASGADAASSKENANSSNARSGGGGTTVIGGLGSPLGSPAGGGGLGGDGFGNGANGAGGGIDDLFDEQLTTALKATRSAFASPLSFGGGVVLQLFHLVVQFVGITTILVVSGVYGAHQEIVILSVALALFIIGVVALMLPYRLALVYHCCCGFSLVVAGLATIANTFTAGVDAPNATVTPLTASPSPIPTGSGSDGGSAAYEIILSPSIRVPLAGTMAGMIVVVYLIGCRSVELFSELDAVRLSSVMAFESVWATRLVTYPTLIAMVTLWFLVAIVCCVVCWVGGGSVWDADANRFVVEGAPADEHYAPWLGNTTTSSTITDGRHSIGNMPVDDIIVLFATVAAIVVIIMNAIVSSLNAHRQVRARFAIINIRARLLEGLWAAAQHTNPYGSGGGGASGNGSPDNLGGMLPITQQQHHGLQSSLRGGGFNGYNPLSANDPTMVPNIGGSSINPGYNQYANPNNNGINSTNYNTNHNISFNEPARASVVSFGLLPNDGPIPSEMDPDTMSAGMNEGRREGVFGSVTPAAFAQQFERQKSGGIHLAGRDLCIDGELLIYTYDNEIRGGPLVDPNWGTARSNSVGVVTASYHGGGGVMAGLMNAGGGGGGGNNNANASGMPPPLMIRSPLQDIHQFAAMVCINPSGCITYWNQRMENLTGFKQMDVLGSSIYSVIIGGEAQQKQMREALTNTLKDANLGTRLKLFISSTKRMQQSAVSLDFAPFPAKSTLGLTIGVLLVGNSDVTEVLKKVADDLYELQTHTNKQQQQMPNGSGTQPQKGSVDSNRGDVPTTFPTLMAPAAMMSLAPTSAQPLDADVTKESPTTPIALGQTAGSANTVSGSFDNDYALTKITRVFARLNDAIEMIGFGGGSGISNDDGPTQVSLQSVVGRIVSTRFNNRKINIKIAPNMLPATLDEERLSFVLMEALQHYTARNHGVTLSVGYDVKRSGAIAFNFQPQGPFASWAPSSHSTACLEKLRAMVRQGYKGAITLIFLSTVSTASIPLISGAAGITMDGTMAVVGQGGVQALEGPVPDPIRCNIALLDANPITNTLIRTHSWNRKHLLYFIDDMESLETSLDSVDVLFVRFPKEEHTAEEADHLLRRLIVSKTYLFIVLVEPLPGNPNLLKAAYGERITVLEQPVTLSILQAAFNLAVDFVVKKKQRERKAMETRELFATAKSAPWVRGALLGQGSFATVYEATNTVTKGKMAVRIIKIDKSGADPETVDKLVRDTIGEIKLMASLEHKNIISYLYCELDTNAINVFMEYAERGSLMSVLKKGPVPVEVAAGWVRDILCGLDYLHGQGVIHLDLKAANVLLTGDGTCKLADFGTAKQFLNVAGRRNSAGIGIAGVEEGPAGGTLHFMAPEVLAGDTASWRADIWSLGCVVIELLTGKPPHSHIDNPLAVVRYISLLTPDDMPIIPASITNTDALKFIEACLRVDPEQRPSAQTLMVHPFILENAVKENALKQQTTKQMAHPNRRMTTRVTASGGGGGGSNANNNNNNSNGYNERLSISEDSNDRRESCFSTWGAK